MISHITPGVIPRVPVPYTYNSVDWARLVRDYPPPPHFLGPLWTMSTDERRALQQSRLAECLSYGWRTHFYRQRWEAAGLWERRPDPR